MFERWRVREGCQIHPSHKMANKKIEIKFPAQVSQVRTLADGGLRVVIDLPEDAIPQSAMLMECKRQGIPLVVTIRADE
jgi:hypothetical protein